MPIFGTIKSDSKVFTGDKLRVEVSAILTPDLILATPKNLEVSFDSGVTWFDVTAKKGIIEWIFSTSGSKVISLKVTTTLTNQIFTETIEVLNLATANLFSNDNDLYAYEPEVDKYQPKKWDSWNPLHWEAQKQILQWLNDKGIVDENGDPYLTSDIMNITQVRELSIVKVLGMIMRGNSNQVDDIFKSKAEYYEELVNQKAAKAQITLDYNANGIADKNEKTDLRVVNVIRR